MAAKQKDRLGPDDGSAAFQERISSLEKQLAHMAGMFEQVMSAMGAGPQDNSQNESAEIGQPSDWSEDKYFVRIKPYDERRGFKRRRTLVPEIGRPINGGTGKVGDIPEWIPLDRDRAQQLLKYHQDDNDLTSPYVFDIVTARERETIDQREAQQRMASLGMVGIPPAEVLRRGATHELQARVGPPPAVRPAPAVVAGADHFSSQARTQQPMARQPLQAEAPVQAGRRQALEGLSAPPPPPPSAMAGSHHGGKMTKTGYNPDAVATDLAFQAAADPGLDAAMEAASQVGGGTGRLAPA